MAEIKVKQAEAKNLRLYLTSKTDKTPIDLSTATLTFTVAKRGATPETLFTVTDSEIDKSGAVSGVIFVPLSSTNLNQTPGKYVAELKIYFSADNIDKSDNIDFIVERAING